MRISDWSSDVCSSDLCITRGYARRPHGNRRRARYGTPRSEGQGRIEAVISRRRDHARPTSRDARPRPARRTAARRFQAGGAGRSEEHTSELQSLMRISYAVFCLKKQKKNKTQTNISCEKSKTKTY